MSAKQAFLEALRALVGRGVIDVRLNRAAGHLQGLDGDAVPDDLRKRVEALRSELRRYQTPDGEYPRDTPPPARTALAHEILDLFLSIVGAQINGERP
jgi:hypothetical protein